MTGATYTTSGAWAAGVATLAADGRVLDTWYPAPALGEAPPGAADADGRPWGTGPGTVPVSASTARHLLDLDLSGSLGPAPLRDVERVPVVTVIGSLADPPLDAHDVYLRLHLLSHRLVAPNQANLEGLFAKLTTAVWTSHGPCAVEGFEQVRLRFRAAGLPLDILGVDKVPRMTDYVIPLGVRIADASRVRLGAHLSEGTTVMHEGFVNFNAGTLGTAMIEGRISQGVVVDDGSDLGGGASLMGTLSGGGTEVVRVGKRSLVGANAGIGISLGDECVVEAGLYVTAGTRVTLPDRRVVKAAELSGQDGLLYRRNSTNGVVEVLPRGERARIELNTELHSHN